MLGLGASDFEFGVDPSADPELALVRWGRGGCRRCAVPHRGDGCVSPWALPRSPPCPAPCPQALRVSMEEQRQRQEEEARRAAAASAAEAGIAATGGDGEQLGRERSCSWQAGVCGKCPREGAWPAEGASGLRGCPSAVGSGRRSWQSPPAQPGSAWSCWGAASARNAGQRSALPPSERVPAGASSAAARTPRGGRAGDGKGLPRPWPRSGSARWLPAGL